MGNPTSEEVMAERARRWEMIEAAPKFSLIRMGYLNPSLYVKLDDHHKVIRLDHSEHWEVSARQNVDAWAHGNPDSWRFEIVSQPPVPSTEEGEQ